MRRTYDGDFDDCTCEPNDAVEIVRRPDGKVLWINVNGSCIFRMCQIPEPTRIFNDWENEP